MEKKSNRGRKIGQYSFAKITLEQLNNIFSAKSITIPVSRIWLQQFGINSDGAPAKEIAKTPVNIEQNASEIFDIMPVNLNNED